MSINRYKILCSSRIPSNICKNRSVTDRIFGYASAELNIMKFGSASAVEYLALASVCFGSVNKISKIFGYATVRLNR